MNNTNTTTGTIDVSPVDIEALKKQGKTFLENTGASIIDIGDRVALVEFHTKANSLSDVILDMLSAALQEGLEKFDAIVIGNRGRHFSAGANLPWMLETARAGNWRSMEQTMRRLQDTNMLMKYGPVPVVAAPFSNALGGGCEIVLHSTAVVAAEELHIGLVEAGVGLVPAGGGTKELRLRALTNFADNDRHDLIAALHNVFKTILFAKVSKNGAEAKQLFLSAADKIVPGSQSPIEAAKQYALELVQAGYYPAAPDNAIPVPGKTGLHNFQQRIEYMFDAGSITAHDVIVALHIAKILCGGDVASGTATEQQLLDLEREAFLSLLGTQKTQERIEYLLNNNKPLHN